MRCIPDKSRRTKSGGIDTVGLVGIPFGGFNGQHIFPQGTIYFILFYLFIYLFIYCDLRIYLDDVMKYRGIHQYHGIT